MHACIVQNEHIYRLKINSIFFSCKKLVISKVSLYLNVTLFFTVSTSDDYLAIKLSTFIIVPFGRV